MKTIMCCGQKGGIGKTTITQLLIEFFAMNKKRVLAIDLDTQASLTLSLLGETKSFELWNFLSGKPSSENMIEDVSEAFVHGYGYTKIIPSSGCLMGLLYPKKGDEDYFHLYHFLQREDISSQFDYCFIDTPASVNFLSNVGMVAADALIYVMQPSQYGTHSVWDYYDIVSYWQEKKKERLGLIEESPKSVCAIFNATPRTSVSKILIENAKETFSSVLGIEVFGGELRYASKLLNEAQARIPYRGIFPEAISRKNEQASLSFIREADAFCSYVLNHV